MPGPRVCVVGSLNVDTILTVPVLPAAGETGLATSRSTTQGGKGSNQAVAAASQGGTVSFVAALGGDAAGAEGLAHLSARGVDVSAVRVLEGPSTGAAVVLVAEDGENVIVVDQGANGLLDSDWVCDQVTRLDPDLVLAQLEVPFDSVLAAAEAAGERPFVLNPAPMPEDPSRLAPILPLCDVLVPNRPELARLAGEPAVATLEDVDRCAARLAFPGTLVVTLGADGAAVYAPGGGRRLTVVRPPAVEVVDTTGAGDAFCGVLANRLARGFDVVAAVEDATRLSALSTTVRGAQVPERFPAVRW